jgi:hypothetical protein
MRLSKKYPKIMLVGTAIAFIFSGIDCLENNLLAIAVASFFVGAVNLAACFVHLRHPFFTKILLLVLNGAFAFLSSYVYFTAGRDLIQYGWAAVGLISIIAIITAFVKRACKKPLAGR